MKNSELMERWLGAVNQPVVNSVQLMLKQVLHDVSDNGSFNPQDTVDIVKELVDAELPEWWPNPKKTFASSERLRISIDRQGKSWAVFHNFDCVRDFAPYSSEAVALTTAKLWCRRYSVHEPEVVYPQITSMRITRRKK